MSRSRIFEPHLNRAGSENSRMSSSTNSFLGQKMVHHTEKSLTLEAPFRREVLKTRSGENGVEPEVPLLPATYRNREHMVRLVRADMNAFLEDELDISRLNRIHGWLWLVGLPTTPRALHYQRMRKRDIVVTEKLDLHLVWSPSRILIKPLPRYLLSPQFWQSHICPDQKLYRVALGFILSYVALIEREVDFHMAVEMKILPKEVEWTDWLALVEEIVLASAHSRAYLSSVQPSSSTSSISSLDTHVPVNKRFYYGELRLGRLNWIYRLVLGQPRGYLSGCTTYATFFRDNVNSLITLFAYTTVVLSAMQVGLATHWLADDYAFGMASYVFSVFSILAPLSAIGAIILVLMFSFVVNLRRTLRIRRKRDARGAGV